MTNIGNTRRSTGSSPKNRLLSPPCSSTASRDQEDIYGAPAAFNAVKGSDNGNAHLVLGPWHHGEANAAASTLGPLDWGSDTGKWFRQNVLLPFLDQHLNGGQPSNIARVTAFEVGSNQWQRLNDWPLACARGCPAGLTPLYLAPGKSLSFTAPAAKRLRLLRLRPSQAGHLPRPPEYPAMVTRFDLALLWLEDDQRFAEARPDVLTYETEPLTGPLTLRGTPQVHLVASTSGTDSDWVDLRRPAKRWFSGSVTASGRASAKH